MDHGSSGRDVAMRQWSLLSRAGVTTLCATPHFYPQTHVAETFLRDRAASLEAALTRAEENHVPHPRIIPGAEVLICEGLEHMPELPLLCLEGTRLLLLEMPLFPSGWNDRLYDTAEAIAAQGIVPILAHVDRYPTQLLQPLFRMGLRGQVNVTELSPRASLRRRLASPGNPSTAELTAWVGEGIVVAWGSDLHGEDPAPVSAIRQLQNRRPALMQRLAEASSSLLPDAAED